MDNIHIKRILIPTDFSDTAEVALNQASMIGRLFHSELTLLHVRESFANEVIFPDLIHPVHFTQQYDENARERLAKAAQNLANSSSLTVNAILSSGPIATEIRNCVKDNDIDMVVMGTHGISGLSELLIGSNAYRVVNSVKCPVLTARKFSASPVYRTIAVPLDLSTYSREKIPFAAHLAKKTGGQIKLLVMRENDERDTLRKMDAIAMQVTRYLDQHKINFEKHDVQTTNYARETINFANYSKADLILIMSEQETSISGLLLGHWAQQVVNHSPIPVLTLSPNQKHTSYNIFS